MQHPYIQNYLASEAQEEADIQMKSDHEEEYYEVINMGNSSTDNSNPTDDEYLEQELKDYVAIDISKNNIDLSEEQNRPTKKESKRYKGLDMSFKLNSPTLNNNTIRNRINNVINSGYQKSKDKSLVLSSKQKLKFDTSPNKHKKNLSINNSDRDLTYLYRMKKRPKGNNNSEKHFDPKPIVTIRDISTGYTKRPPESLKSYFKNKIEEYVFQKDTTTGDSNLNESLNIYDNHPYTKVKLNNTLYCEKIVTSSDNFPSSGDIKLNISSKNPTTGEITPKMSKLNFMKQKINSQTNSTFIDSTYKKFPITATEASKDWQKDGVLYSSLDQTDTIAKSNKTLKNKQGLFNKKISLRNPVKSQLNNRNNNINIVINKFYDKAKVYCQTDDISTPNRVIGGIKKQFTHTTDSNLNKKSAKALPEVNFQF